MRISSDYRIVFDKEGEIFFSDAPFCKANTSKLIGDYLPLFAEQDIFEEIINKPIHPYEFSVGNKRYLVDVSLDRLKKNNELYYDLTLKDRTPLYKNFQKERTEKNIYRKRNGELLEVNKRLKLKLKELEDVIAFIVSDEIKVPIGNLKNSLKLITSEPIEDSRRNKIMALAMNELDTMESLFGALEEVNTFACSSSFEDAYYCGLTEILDDVAQQMSLQNSKIIFEKVKEERLFFVNKFHLSKIIQNTVLYFNDDPSTCLAQLEVVDKTRDDKADLVAIELSLKYKSDMTHIEDGDLMINLNQKKNEMSLRTASKIAQVYDGQIKILSNQLESKTALITFEGLMSKKESQFMNHTDLGGPEL